jgi:hypothetical protein
MGLAGVDKEGTKEMEKRVDKRERRDRADTWTPYVRFISSHISICHVDCKKLGDLYIVQQI